MTNVIIASLELNFWEIPELILVSKVKPLIMHIVGKDIIPPKIPALQGFTVFYDQSLMVRKTFIWNPFLFLLALNGS